MYNKIILYNDKDLLYFTGNINTYKVKENYIDVTTLADTNINKIKLNTEIYGQVHGYQSQTIELDETLMKRIAKYNKEAEIKKYDEIIEDKQKKIKELDNILQDKEKRVDKIKEFIADIYDINIEEDDYDEDYNDYEEE